MFFAKFSNFLHNRWTSLILKHIYSHPKIIEGERVKFLQGLVNLIFSAYLKTSRNVFLVNYSEYGKVQQKQQFFTHLIQIRNCKLDLKAKRSENAKGYFHQLKNSSKKRSGNSQHTCQLRSLIPENNWHHDWGCNWHPFRQTHLWQLKQLPVTVSHTRKKDLSIMSF